jgi:rare lipoprotein A (peptidoglycan hydrolase)
MRDYILLACLCFLLLNCLQLEAKTRHHIKVAGKEIIKNEVLAKGSQDSLRLKDSLDSVIKNFKGVASWYYSYRRGLFAASTKFKKGSILRVVNPINNRHVDVVVSDYGPNKRYSKRIIDLDVIAFQKIAPLGKGLIKIIIFPIEIL